MRLFIIHCYVFMDGCGAATPCYVWRGGSDRDSGCIGADGCVFDVVEGGGEEWLSVVWNGMATAKKVKKEPIIPRSNLPSKKSKKVLNDISYHEIKILVMFSVGFILYIRVYILWHKINGTVFSTCNIHACSFCDSA